MSLQIENACIGSAAAAATGKSERVTEIRSYVAKGLTATADLFAKRFEKGDEEGAPKPDTLRQGERPFVVDLLQGLQLRGKVGIGREQLLQEARSYVPLILGKKI